MSIYIYIYCKTVYICDFCLALKEESPLATGATVAAWASMAGVKKNAEGKACGLVVKENFARRFLESEEERKVYEIRSKPIKFLSEGDKILLVSSPSELGGRRQVTAMLQFDGNIRIKCSSFQRYFSLHRTSTDEFQFLLENWSPAEDLEYVWAWHLELVEKFDPPIPVRSVPGTISWTYLGPGDLLQDPRHLSTAKSMYIYIFIHI